MDDAEARNSFCQSRQRFEDGGVDGVRALAASEDQQRWLRVVRPRRDVEEFATNGNAGDLAVAEVGAGLLELDGGGFSSPRRQSIGEARDDVRLEGDRRNAKDAAHQHRRSGSVAADADHDVGSKLADQLEPQTSWRAAGRASSLRAWLVRRGSARQLRSA